MVLTQVVLHVTGNDRPDILDDFPVFHAEISFCFFEDLEIESAGPCLRLRKPDVTVLRGRQICGMDVHSY